VAGATDYALCVKIIDALQFPGSIGEIRWAGVPQSVTDGALGMINVSQTQCDPVYVDWSVTPEVSLYGIDIVPGAVYEVRAA